MVISALKKSRNIKALAGEKPPSKKIIKEQEKAAELAFRD